MKILIYIDSLVSGGSERTVSYLANYFVEQKNSEVEILLNKNIIFYDINEKVRINILPLKNSKNNIITRILNIIKRYFYLRKVNKRFKPDIILSFLYKSL